MACCRVAQGPLFVPALWVGDVPSHEFEPWGVVSFLFSLADHPLYLQQCCFKSLTVHLWREVKVGNREAKVGKDQEEEKGSHDARSGQGSWPCFTENCALENTM